MPPDDNTPTPHDYETYQLRGLYHRTVAEKEEEFVVNLLRPRAGRVLEVGPGAGRFTRHLVDLTDSLTVCDLDEALLAKTAARLGPRPNVAYEKRSFEELDRLPHYGAFDAAVAIRAVPHAADWRGALQRLVFAVRPGGLVIFDLWNRQSFVGLLMKLLPRQEPITLHRLTRRELQDAIACLPSKPIATLRWGYPRLGPFHLDDLGAMAAPSWAYSTLFCLQVQTQAPKLKTANTSRRNEPPPLEIAGGER